MSTPNIAFLLDSAPRIWCSQEDRHLEICKALIARGGRPVLVFSNALPKAIENRFREAGIEVAAISYTKGIFNYLKELDNLLEKHQVTGVHIIFFDYFSAMSWIAKTRRVKYIIYEMQNGGVFRARSWKRMLLQIRNKLATLPMTQVIAISSFIKEQLLAGGVREEKIVVRHLGIDTNHFRPDAGARKEFRLQHGIGEDDLLLSTISYLKPIKNPQTLVEALGILKQRNLPAYLFVAGDGEMLAELQALSRTLGVEDRIRWLGLVADPTTLLQASDLFLLATTGEAFGLVLAEAMACGVPVVGTRSGGIPEVVADEETGLLVPVLDAKAFADAIERLGKDKELYARFRQRGIERVNVYFTMETTVEKTMQIYESLSRGNSSVREVS